MLKYLFKSISRKKSAEENILKTQLKRCLNLFDLTMIGTGSMVGAGIFVVTGTLTRDITGPGIILSYIFAGFAALLSSLSYAEFGAKMPKAGSAYSYTYLVMGELPAFLVGWNMVLETVIGSASVAKAASGSLDMLLSGVIRNGTMQYVGSFEPSWMSEYPDFVGLAFVLFWSVFVALGAKVSTTLNNIFTVINVSVLIAVVGCGIYFADTSNWTNHDRGGFLPYGFSGVIAGSASCFYSYSGFEVITTAAEESKNPSKHIPIALTTSLIFVTLLYVSASCALTLMVPYNQVNILAPFPAALQYHDLTWGKRMVAVGALMGLSASVLSGMFSMPRTVYAIALDGLLFKSLATVNGKTQTPINSILLFASITAVLATLVNLKTLVELLSIGTLSCFILVSINVILLRYQPQELNTFLTTSNSTSTLTNGNILQMNGSTLQEIDNISQDNEIEVSDTKHLMEIDTNNVEVGSLKKAFCWIPGLKHLPKGTVAPISVTLMVASISVVVLMSLNLYVEIANAKWWVILLLCIFTVSFFASFLLLYVHQHNKNSSTFQVPFVPFIPVLSLVINVYLILNLNHWTWIRLVLWLIIGLIFYFAYGIRHSEERHKSALFNTTVQYKPIQNLANEPEENVVFLSAEEDK